MSEKTPRPTREEVLAAKLRENLRRRKEQARAFQADSATSADSGSENAGLSKEPPKS